MKILYISVKYDYGNPDRGLSFEYSNMYDSLVRMNGRENNALHFPIDQMAKKFGDEGANKKLLEVVHREKPDVCFFYLFNNWIKKETIKQITEKSRAITLNWFSDDHWRFYNYSKHWAPYFDWIVTTDPMAIRKYHKIGYKNVIFSQWACNHFLCRPLNLTKIYDVAFLGQPHGNRRRIIDKIRRAGIDIKCWGWGWPRGCVSPEEMVKIFSQSKINLGLTNSSAEGIVMSLARIFFEKNGGKINLVNPAKWFDNTMSVLAKGRSQIKGRNYDVPGCGSFLLTQDADDLKDRYRDGKEIVIFKDADDLIKKIRYYLKHEEEREKISEAGYRRTIENHTYEKRFDDIFKIITKK